VAKDKRLELRLSPDEDVMVKELADRNGMSVSGVVRKLLKAANVQAGLTGVRTARAGGALSVHAVTTAVRTADDPDLFRYLSTMPRSERILSYSEKLSNQAVVIHNAVSGAPPNAVQARFYEQLWKVRATGMVPSDESAQATVVAALAFATLGAALRSEVSVLVKTVDAVALTGTLEAVSEAVSYVEGALGIKLKSAIESVSVVTGPPWPELVLSTWVAFGLANAGEVPPWARNALPAALGLPREVRHVVLPPSVGEAPQRLLESALEVSPGADRPRP
jgi:hypothetical protein